MKAMEQKPTAVIYVRVSTVRQADDGLPIGSQIEQAEAKAKQLHATVLRIFRDEGISGRTDRRPAFQDAVAYCSAVRVDYFIVWNTSRFARNKIDAASYKALLKQGGTRVVYAAADIDSETDEGWFSESIFEIVDEHYSRVISRDTRRSMMKNARDGFFNGGRIPFGYLTVPDGKRKRLSINADEAQTVRDLFNWYLQGAGTKELAMKLNEASRLKRGVAWNKTTVGLILKNPVYSGYVVFNRTEHRSRSLKPDSDWVTTKSHPAIISEEQWMRVQEIMSQRAPRENGGSPHSRHVFTGLLRCGKCGASLQTESATGRSATYHYYNCRTSLKGAGCASRRIPADELDRWLIDVILERVLTKERITEMVRDVYELRGELALERERRRSELVAELRATEKRREKLFDIMELHGKEAPNLGDITQRLRKHKARIEEIETSLATIEDGVDSVDFAIDEHQIDAAVSFFREIISTSDDPVKLRTFFSSFVERIVVEESIVKIEYVREKILLNQNGSTVHREKRWLPDLGLVRTTTIECQLPDRWRKAA